MSAPRFALLVAIAVGSSPAAGTEPAAVITLPGTQYPELQRPVENIIVTGSRIPRGAFESLQPAFVIDDETLRQRGRLDLASALNEQAGFAPPAISPIEDQASSDIGQNYVDFLGLGAQRTLTLVDGQRVPAGISPTSIGGLAVDLNLIPEQLVERVETIAVGGVPVYGTDAIAGTVNIIMRRDLDGFEWSAAGGGSPKYGDFWRRRLAASWGTPLAGGDGHVTLAAQYSGNQGLRRTDRDATATFRTFTTPADPDSPFTLALFDDIVIATGSRQPYPLYFGDRFGFNRFGNGIPLDIADPGSPLAQFDEAGNLTPLVAGGGTGSPVFVIGGDGLRLAEVSSLVHEMERFNLTVLSRHALGPRVSGVAEAWFARTLATQTISQGAYNSPAFGGLPDDDYGRVGRGPIPVLIDSPYLPLPSRDAIAAALNVVHDFDGDGQADPTIDTDGDGGPDAVGFWRGGALTRVLGDAPVHTQRDLRRFVAGFDGAFSVAGKPWTWNLRASVGRTRAKNREREILQPSFDQAVQVLADPQGRPQCADPSAGCVPLNVVGRPSREAIDYVSRTLTQRVTIRQRSVDANLGGPVLTLPAGEWDLAGGYALRREDARFDPDPASSNGVARFARQAFTGGFSTSELYLETVVPVLGALTPGFGPPLLDFEGALRWVDNSVAGADTTWTAGMRLRPIPDLELRGNRTRSIRAPSITELFTPETVIFDRANDPCDGSFIDKGNVPDRRRRNCAADGIQQPFQSIIVAVDREMTVSGNPTLDSEQADAASVGIVLRPRAIPGLTLAIDHFEIQIHHAIETLTGTDILRACYDSAAFPDEAACARFSRDADGQVNAVRTGFLNLGLVDFRGWQTVLSWQSEPGPAGMLGASLNHLRTERHSEVPGSGNRVELAGEIGRSQDRLTAAVNWSLDGWSAYAQLRWLGPAVFDNADGPFTRTVRGVGSYSIVDASLSRAFGRHGLQLRLTIDNLLDAAPPQAALAARGSLAPYISGIIGRYVQLGVEHTF